MSSLDFLIALEQLRSPVMDAVMIGLSALGSEEFYLALLATIYLCVSHRFGFHLLMLFLASTYSNGMLKSAFGTQRPFVMYPDDMHPLYPGSGGGFSFPSGHSESAAVVWGMIALRVDTWPKRIVPLLLILGIAFSRLYLQVHWPADIFGGLGFGALLLLIYLVLVGAWQSGKRRLDLEAGAWLSVGVSLVMWLGSGGIGSCVNSAGVLLGVGLGYVLLEARGGYKASAPLLSQIAKVLIGVAALLGVRVGLKQVLGDSNAANYARYAFMGFTCAYLLPAFFAGFHNWRRRASRAMEMLEEEDEED